MKLIKNKNWYKSKTVWAGVFAAVLGILTAMGIDPMVSGVLVTIAGAFGIYGRVVTETKINKF